MKLGLCLIQVAGCGMYKDIITALPVSWRLYKAYVHAQCSVFNGGILLSFSPGYGD